jgi:hypothetical protein
MCIGTCCMSRMTGVAHGVGAEFYKEFWQHMARLQVGGNLLFYTMEKQEGIYVE